MNKSKIVLLLLCIFGSYSYAQQGAPGTYMYQDGPNGTRQIVPATSAARGQQIWDKAVYNTATGQVAATSTAQVPNPSGVAVPATASGTVPRPNVAAAVGRVAVAVGKTVGFIGVGLAIYDLAKELGFTYGKDAAGAPVITKTDPEVCTVAPCYTRVITQDYTYRNTNVTNTCLGWFQNWNPSQGPQRKIGVTAIPYPAEGLCYITRGPNNSDFWLNVFPEPGPVAPAGSDTVPSTLQELTDAVAAKSGWPVNSKINDVMGQDPLPELQAPTSVIVSGPASSPGPTSVTTDATNNTTSRSTTTYNHTYAGDTITTTNNTTNITTNNTTGAVTSNTTIVSSPQYAPAPAPTIPGTSPAPAPAPAASAAITCGLPGTPACKIDETGIAPNAGTTYDNTKTAIDTAKSSAETNIGGASQIAAPSWSFSFQLPTGCAPYVTGIKGVILNVCQYQSTIHGLLSAIWAAATAFAMIGMVGRTIRES